MGSGRFWKILLGSFFMERVFHPMWGILREVSVNFLTVPLKSPSPWWMPFSSEVSKRTWRPRQMPR